MKNYLKIAVATNKLSRFFFFEDAITVQRERAWKEALAAAGGDATQISIWRADARGRYPDERFGEAHAIVGEALMPISPETRVIGIVFRKSDTE